MDAPPRDFADDEFADAMETLRAMRVVQREVGAVAAQHRLGRLGQCRGWDMLRIVVAADKIVFGKAGPARRRRRQILVEQMAVRETGGGHGVILYLIQSPTVITGLDPAIHVLLRWRRKAWMAGTNPAMTATERSCSYVSARKARTCLRPAA